MPKYRFIKFKDDNNRYDVISVTIDVDTVMRQDLIDSFTSFLQACDYPVDGKLEIVVDDTSGVPGEE